MSEILNHPGTVSAAGDRACREVTGESPPAWILTAAPHASLDRVNPPKVIATDLDRTLLRTDGTTSERTRAALDLAMERGAQVIAVTARPIRWLDRLKPCFGRLPHVIASNGAVCYDLAGGGGVRRPAVRPGDAAQAAGRPCGPRCRPRASRWRRRTAWCARPDYELSLFDQDGDDAGRRVVAYRGAAGGGGRRAAAEDPGHRPGARQRRDVRRGAAGGRGAGPAHLLHQPRRAGARDRPG